LIENQEYGKNGVLILAQKSPSLKIN